VVQVSTMNTVPTYRQGRKVYQPGARDKGGIAGICSFLFIALLLLVPPFALIFTETIRYKTYTTLSDTLNTKIVELPHEGFLERGDLVHGTSSHIESTTSDIDMGLTIPGALTLTRKTEYCQWEELEREVCQTCTRTVEASDGSTSEESYDCDCVTSYNYVKMWRSHRINALMFDQPAAHHNPMRDPLPPTTFLSQDATLNFMDREGNPRTSESSLDIIDAAYIEPQMFDKKVRGATLRPMNWVRRGVPPVPSFWARWMPDRTRYENTSDLYNTQPTSYAAQTYNFVYVGDGYFFSPYRATSYESLFKYFVQYVEGSLFDWQIGDIMPSCTSGDIRVWYQVQDPKTVSFLGQATSFASFSQTNTVTVEPHRAQNGVSVGFVHVGAQSVEEMIVAEDSDSWWQAFIPRIFLILWSISLSRLIGAVIGRNVSNAKRPTQVASAGAVWCGVVGISWVFIWGYSLDTVFMILLCLGLLFVVKQFPPPLSESTAGLKAGWCMLARWAHLPPKWRIEDTYQKKASNEYKNR